MAYGAMYDPIEPVRQVLIRERSAIQEAMESQLAEAFGGKPFESLSASQQERHKDVVDYYEEVQRRMLWSCPAFVDG